jgi:hypothetical protein
MCSVKASCALIYYYVQDTVQERPGDSTGGVEETTTPEGNSSKIPNMDALKTTKIFLAICVYSAKVGRTAITRMRGVVCVSVCVSLR